MANEAPPRNRLDDTICDLTYFYIKNALYLIEVMNKTVKRLHLDSEISASAKKSLKKDFGFTSNAIYQLGQARRAYEALIRSLNVVEQELDGRIRVENFDLGQADAYDLLSVDLVYLFISNGNMANAKKFHNYLKKYKWDEDFTTAYNNLQTHYASLMRSYQARNSK